MLLMLIVLRQPWENHLSVLVLACLACRSGHFFVCARLKHVSHKTRRQAFSKISPRIWKNAAFGAFSGALPRQRWHQSSEIWKTSRFQIQTIKDIKRLHQSSEIWNTDRIFFFRIRFSKFFFKLFELWQFGTRTHHANRLTHFGHENGFRLSRPLGLRPAIRPNGEFLRCTLATAFVKSLWKSMEPASGLGPASGQQESSFQLDSSDDSFLKPCSFKY